MKIVSIRAKPWRPRIFTHPVFTQISLAHTPLSNHSLTQRHAPSDSHT